MRRAGVGLCTRSPVLPWNTARNALYVCGLRACPQCCPIYATPLKNASSEEHFVLLFYSRGAEKHAGAHKRRFVRETIYTCVDFRMSRCAWANFRAHEYRCTRGPRRRFPSVNKKRINRLISLSVNCSQLGCGVTRRSCRAAAAGRICQTRTRRKAKLSYSEIGHMHRQTFAFKLKAIRARKNGKVTKRKNFIHGSRYAKYQ